MVEEKEVKIQKKIEELINKAKIERLRQQLEILLIGWTLQQLEYMQLLANPNYKLQGKKKEWFAELVGVTVQTLTKWEKIDGFNECVNLLSITESLDSLPDVMMAIVARAKGGSNAHARTFLEIHGFLGNKEKIVEKKEKSWEEFIDNK